MTKPLQKPPSANCVMNGRITSQAGAEIFRVSIHCKRGIDIKHITAYAANTTCVCQRSTRSKNMLSTIKPAAIATADKCLSYFCIHARSGWNIWCLGPESNWEPPPLQGDALAN